MIKPARHIDLDHSVLNISAFILKQLNSTYQIKYDILLAKAVDVLGNNVKENYPYALNFLFLLGKITYNDKLDSFKRNETK